MAVLGLAVWTLFGICSVGQAWMWAWSTGGTLPSDQARDGMLGVWLWALVTPAILTACEFFPVEQPHRLRNLAAHVGVGVLLWVNDTVVWTLLSWWRDDPPVHFLLRLGRNLFTALFSYVCVAALGHALRFHTLYVERRVRASELMAQLVRARLLALQMQLRPHFLFNALNTITGLIRTGNSRSAIQMTAGLADLLRAVLRGDGSQEVPLRQELDFVERYLRLEQVRFQERLSTHIQVDPEVTHALVPHLLLQPLVENAVRHGTRGEAENRVDITITREADVLWLRVRDTGRGLTAREAAAPEPGVPREGGIGLANTRARLRHLYGDAQRLELLPAEGGGTLVQVAIPFRPAPEVPRPEVSRP
jgi:hypothetical protein